MIGMGSADVRVGGAMIASGKGSGEQTREAVYLEAQSTAGSVAATVTQDISLPTSAVSTINAARCTAQDLDNAGGIHDTRRYGNICERRLRIP
jgi:hypothetical protein